MAPGSGWEGAGSLKAKIRKLPAGLLGCFFFCVLFFLYGLLFSLLRPDCHSRLNRVFPRACNSPHQRGGGIGGGVGCWVGWSVLFLPSFQPPRNSFHTVCARSPRAETLMKTNARNQFEASSFHLAGARLCTSISTPAGGELHQGSPLSLSLSHTHTQASAHLEEKLRGQRRGGRRRH